jgi:hypothetical protein
MQTSNAQIWGPRSLSYWLIWPIALGIIYVGAAWVFTSAIVVPATDFLVVPSTNGRSDTFHLLVHALTAVYMLITSFLLFKHQQS